MKPAGRWPRCSSLMTMQLRVRPCRGRAAQRWAQLSDRFSNRLLIEVFV